MFDRGAGVEMANILELEDKGIERSELVKNTHLNYEHLKVLEKEHGSSFYILHVQKLKDNFKKIQYAFNRRYDNFIIGYSYKTNYLPYLCKELMKLGAYAEVVSRLEYDLAIKIGVDPSKIIFNGPLKTKNDIATALNNGSIVNIDSMYEVAFIKEYCQLNKKKKVKVGLRVNFNITSNGESPLVGGHDVSRFGMCVENGTYLHILKTLASIPNLKIAGLHGHFSTSERKVESFRNITKGLCQLAKETFTDQIEYIDIGGGIFGEVPKSLIEHAPTFDDYAEAVCEIMNHEFRNSSKKPALILEPGIAMVANTFTFIAKVIETKKIRDNYFVLVDGSVHNVKPTMHKKNLPMTIIKQNLTSYTGKGNTPYHIVGYTCLEKDYLAKEIQGIVPNINDYITFENVGAYTIVFNPQFIKERPAILAVEGEEVTVVRKKESLKEFFNENLYSF